MNEFIPTFPVLDLVHLPHPQCVALLVGVSDEMSALLPDSRKFRKKAQIYW
jgi:hypothetical protein